MSERSDAKIEQGTILEYSWGYDQTNVDWFIVTRRTLKIAVLRRIRSEVTESPSGSMQGTSVPSVQVELYGKELRRKVQHSADCGEYLSMDYGNAYVWDGKPVRASWYA